VAGRGLYERVLGRPAHNPLAWDGVDQATSAQPPRSLGRNLLISALVFLGVAVAYLLARRAS
jgi:hypothetical protein